MAANPARRQKRIAKEAQTCEKLTLEQNGIYVDPKTTKSGTWIVYMQGPVNTIWETGVFRLDMSFPDGYPFDPIKIAFNKPIFHPNVGANNSKGAICLDIIRKEKWSPSYATAAVLTSIRSLLSDPNPSSPMNGEAARLFTSKMAEYKTRVAKTIKDYGQELAKLKNDKLQLEHNERPDDETMAKLKERGEVKGSSGTKASPRGSAGRKRSNDALGTVSSPAMKKQRSK